MGEAARLIAAYRRSTYHVGDIVVRIGRRSAAMDGLLRRHGVRNAVLTGAWNPLSRRMPVGWNRRADCRLAGHLRRLCWLPADGGTGRWREAHALVLGDPRPAVLLSRRFRQRAVVLLARGQGARLLVLR